MKGQSLLKGSTYIYNSDKSTQGISVVVIDSIENNKLLGVAVDSIGIFHIGNIPNGLINLQFQMLGCYSTIIKEINLLNDTLTLNQIPLFEANYTLNWDGIKTKKLFWGLIKYKKGIGGTEYIENSQFPPNNKIYIKTKESPMDSILYELNPTTENVEIKYEKIKNVW